MKPLMLEMDVAQIFLLEVNDVGNLTIFNMLGPHEWAKWGQQLMALAQKCLAIRTKSIISKPRKAFGDGCQKFAATNDEQKMMFSHDAVVRFFCR